MRRLACLLAVFLLILPSRAGWPEASTAFAKKYASPDPAERLKAVRGLRDFDCVEAVPVLLECWRGEPEADVRDALSDVVARIADPKARAIVSDTILKHPTPEVRARYCALLADGRQPDRTELLAALLVDSSPVVRIRALGYIGPKDLLTLPDVGGLLEDPSGEIRFAAAGALAAIGSVDAVPWLADRLAVEKGEGQWAVQNALEKITGKKLGPEAKAWVAWWKEKTATEPPEVREAVERAAGWLKEDTEKKLTGALWRGGKRKKGKEQSAECRGLALQIHALIHAGLPDDDPVIEDGVYWLETAPLVTTYDVACMAMALADHGARRHVERLTEIGQWLVDAQCRNGQWSYPGDGTVAAKTVSLAKPPERSGPGGGTTALPAAPILVWKDKLPRAATGDNSNTQYGVLGLRAALEVCDVPNPVFERTLRFFESNRHGGGWGYQSSDAAYNSMTAAGISSVIICLNALDRTEGLEPDKVEEHKTVGPAIKYLVRGWTLKPDAMHQSFGHYYLYGLERAAVLAGLEKFGKHDWYREGCAYLLSRIASTGMAWGGVDPAQNTAFAILFLKRASKTLVGKPKRREPAKPPPPPDVESGK